MTRIPIACALEGGELKARWQRWSSLVERAATSRREIPGGVQLRFEPDVGGELDELIAAERACCAWAAWEVRDDGQQLVLAATADTDPGPDALRAFFPALEH